MKKILFLIITLFILQCLNSQTIHVRTTHYAYSYMTNSDYEEWSPWNEADLIILINLDNNTITIDNQYEDKFYLRTLITTGDKRDNDGDTYRYFEYICYDQENKSCRISLNSWNNYNICHLYIYYSNVRYVYEGKIID